MAYTLDALKGKITEMYPEIKQHDIMLSLEFDANKDAYRLKFNKGAHELTTYLEKKDADECMNNVKCVYLGVQVGQFVKNFEAGDLGGKSDA